jgi:6-pyruvoyltetrahydropterin/6-carboxytetrahydropterin synthase
MSDTGVYRIRLAKQDFKFSVAHFTVFSAEEAERLHGHNYQVSVAIEGRRTTGGLLADVAAIKRDVRRFCDELDSATLVPTGNPLVEVEEVAGYVEVRYAARRYRLPAADVRLLPLANASMEEFARHLWGRLAPTLAGCGLDSLSVTVEETDGQSCTYERCLEG